MAGNSEEEAAEEEMMSGYPQQTMVDGVNAEDVVTSTRLRNLILSKEKELHDINEYRIQTLEQMLRDRDQLIAESMEKNKKLHEDFQYNLQLIEERDAELDRYDVTFARLKEAIRDKDKEISELKISISEMEARKRQQASRAADVDASYQTSLKEVRDEMDLMRMAHEEELRRRRDEVELVRLDMERQLREKDDEIETQRREITVSFDEVIRQREAESRRREEELVHQVRQLERELVMKNRVLEKAEAERRAAEDQSSRLSEVMAENQELQNQNNRLIMEHEDKMNELLETLHEVEKAFLQQKAEHEQESSRLQSTMEERLESTTRKLEAKAQNLRELLRQAEERALVAELSLKEARVEREEKLAVKTRELDAQEAHFTAELERRESATLALKNQLWNAEAEMKQAVFRLEEATKVNEEKSREISRLKDQMQLMREQIEGSTREAMTRVERFRRDFDGREAELKAMHAEAMRGAMDELDAARREAESFRSQALALEGEALRRQDKILELQDETARLQHELMLRQSGDKRQTAHGGPQRGSQQGEDSEPSPLFSEDMGPASPLRGGGYLDEDQYPARSRAAQGPLGSRVHEARMEDLVAEENRRLRSVIADMRREMESLRVMGQPGHDSSLPPPLASPYRMSADVLMDMDGRSAMKSRREGARASDEAVAGLVKENKELRTENEKLLTNCEKLMEISNELKSRLSKVTEWMAMDAPPASTGNGNGNDPASLRLPPPPPSTRSPLGVSGRRAEQSRGSPARMARPGHMEGEATGDMETAQGRRRLEQVKEELLLAGTSSSLSMPVPPSVPPRASDRETRGQKKASSKLKGQHQQGGGGGGAAGSVSRLGMLMERKKLRNYNVQTDDDP